MVKKKLWNMKLTVISILIGAFGTIPKCLQKRLGELEIGGRIDTFLTSAFLRSPRIQKKNSLRLAVTQKPVNDLKPTLVLETRLTYFNTLGPQVVKWLTSQTSKTSRMRLSVIECPIYSALCYI